MIGYLNTDVSFCKLGDRLFFLDIQRDRYFQLSVMLERIFLRYFEAPDEASIYVDELSKHHLLIDTSLRQARRSRLEDTEILPPDRSLLEMPDIDIGIPFRAIRDVFLAVGMMRWQLKTRRLKPILQDLAAYRSISARRTACKEPEHSQRLKQSAAMFNRVRRYVPIETCCLVDSLSMIRFLARNGFHTCLVIGVSCDPFSAHAWVQNGSLVLNETVGAAQAHAPIRVI